MDAVTRSSPATKRVPNSPNTYTYAARTSQYMCTFWFRIFGVMSFRELDVRMSAKHAASGAFVSTLRDLSSSRVKNGERTARMCDPRAPGIFVRKLCDSRCTLARLTEVSSKRANADLLFEHRHTKYCVSQKRACYMYYIKHSVAAPRDEDSERYYFPVAEGSIRFRRKFWLFPKRHKRRARARARARERDI